MMTRQEKINEQIKMASNNDRNPGWVAIIIESKLTKRARKTWFGFRFERKEDAIIGRTIEHEDGSISTIVAFA